MLLLFFFKGNYMSVQVNQYLIYGVKLNYKDYESRYEEFEPFIDSAFKNDMNPPFCFIYEHTLTEI